MEEPPVTTNRSKPQKAKQSNVRKPATTKAAAATKRRAPAVAGNSARGGKKVKKNEQAPDDKGGGERVVLDYMMHAAQDTKKRTIGQAARSRKEKMPVAEQVRLSREMTTIVGTGTRQPVLPSSSSQALDKETKCDVDALLAEETVAMQSAQASLAHCSVDASDASDASETGDANQTDVPPASPGVVVPMVAPTANDDEVERRGRPLPKTNEDLVRRVRSEQWDKYPERENAGDVLAQPRAGSSVTRVTSSTELRPFDYKRAFVERRFRDTTFAADTRVERQIVDALVADMVVAGGDTSDDTEAAARQRQVLVAKGYGEAFVTFEDLSTTAAHTQHAPSAYPTSTHLRCRYDHHRFVGIPIMIPIEYHEKQNVWSVVPNIVFCSFSCMMAYLERVAQPELKRRNRQKMAKMMARDCFGITDPIRPAPELDQHVDYGGRLTTEQWRALCTTHCSFIEYPMSISVPATAVTEIVIKKRIDRERVGTVRARTADQHSERAPDKPERSHPDAVEDNKRRLKEGKGRPVKYREIRDDSGRLTTLNKDYLDKVIGDKTAARDQREPTRGTMAAFTSPVAAAAAASKSAAPTKKSAAAPPQRKRTNAAHAGGSGGGGMWGSLLKKK